MLCSSSAMTRSVRKPSWLPGEAIALLCVLLRAGPGASVCIPPSSNASGTLCPDAIFVPPDFTRYRAVSHSVREILVSHTDLIKPLSDVTENKIGLVTSYSGGSQGP